MAEAIRTIKVKTSSGTTYDVPIGAAAEDVVYNNTKTGETIQSETETEISKLKAEDINLQNQIDDLVEEDNILDTKIDTTKAALDKVDVNLQSQITTENNKITDLQNVDIALNSELDDLTAEDTRLQGEIDKLNQDLSITTKTTNKDINLSITDGAEQIVKDIKIYGSDNGTINTGYTVKVSNNDSTKTQSYTLSFASVAAEYQLTSASDYYYKLNGTWYIYKNSTKKSAVVTGDSLLDELDLISGLMTYSGTTTIKVTANSTTTVIPSLVIEYYLDTALFKAVIPVIEQIINIYK